MESQFLVSVRLRREDVTSFGDYPFNLPAIQTLDALELHAARDDRCFGEHPYRGDALGLQIK